MVKDDELGPSIFCMPKHSIPGVFIAWLLLGYRECCCATQGSIMYESIEPIDHPRMGLFISPSVHDHHVGGDVVTAQG
jgi:hypothetical protein